MDRKEQSSKVKANKKQGGNRRSQTFRDCRMCGNEFGPLDRLKLRFCSRKCMYGFRKGKPSGKRGKKYPHLQRARVGNCLVCRKEYRAIGDHKHRKQKYCSLKCAQKAWKRNIRPNLINTNPAMEERNKSWKGDDAGCSAMHKWVAHRKGTPSKCEHCGTTTARKFEWANVDHTYLRVLEDYMRLCTSCHRKYDNSVVGMEL